MDIYHLHGFDALAPIEEAFYTLDTFVREGKVRYIACSNFSGWHVMKSVCIGPQWLGTLRRRSGLLLAGCARLWVGIDAAGARSIRKARSFGVRSAGPLTGKLRRGQPKPALSRLPLAADFGPSVQEAYLHSVVNALDEVAKQTGKTIPQVAINWLLQRPTVSSVIVGTRNEEQLRQNIAAVGWKLLPEQIEKLDRASQRTRSYPYWHQLLFAEAIHRRASVIGV